MSKRQSVLCMWGESINKYNLKILLGNRKYSEMSMKANSILYKLKKNTTLFYKQSDKGNKTRPWNVPYK